MYTLICFRSLRLQVGFGDEYFGFELMCTGVGSGLGLTDYLSLSNRVSGLPYAEISGTIGLYSTFERLYYEHIDFNNWWKAEILQHKIDSGPGCIAAHPFS